MNCKRLIIDKSFGFLLEKVIEGFDWFPFSLDELVLHQNLNGTSVICLGYYSEKLFTYLIYE